MLLKGAFECTDRVGLLNGICAVSEVYEKHIFGNRLVGWF